MDLGGAVLFAVIGAIVIVPQVLRHQERMRLHETLRLALERGQPIPPNLILALQASGRRRRYDEPYFYPGPAAGWTQPAAAPAAAEPSPAAAPAAPPLSPAAPVFVNPVRSDLRRGLIWLAVGLGLIGAGGAFYAGLYDVGGAPETFATFAAFGSIPVFIGLTYIALWAFERRRTRV